MEHEGMVHALERIERLLRPDGNLVEIHPVSEAPLIEVRSSGALAFAERDPGYDYEEDLRRAEEAVALVVSRGIFVIDRSREFDFLTYGSSVTELRDFFAQADAYDDRVQEEAVLARRDDVYARVEDVLRSSEKGGDVVYHERGRMKRMTRSG
jgi:hypothetical protein